MDDTIWDCSGIYRWNKKIITENQTVHIPIGCTHSIHNPGIIPVEFLETQIGECIDPSDVFRLEK